MAKKKQTPEVVQPVRRSERLIDQKTDLLDLLSSGVPAAFATDAQDRIVFWNRGAEEVFGYSASRVLGKACFTIVGGRDIFGNRFCYRDCAVKSATRDGEAVRGYEINVPDAANNQKSLGVTIVQIPGRRPDTFTIVHMLQPVDHGSRLAAVLQRMEPPKGAELLSPLSVLPPEIQDNPPLTEREREILHWVAAGLQNKEIAHRLDISLATVRNHIHRILEKLEVHSKLEAISLAFRRGWVAGEEPSVLEN